MANPRQVARDAAAQAKGFKNYYAYRNWLAQQLGYGSYNDQRRARRTGIGLKGTDLKVAPKVKKAIKDLITTGSAPDISKAHWLDGPVRDIVAKFKAQQADIRHIMLSTVNKAKIKPSQAAVLGILKDSKELSDSYYKNYLGHYFERGLKAGANDPLVTMTAEDRAFVEKKIRQGLTNHLRGIQGLGRNMNDLLPKLTGADVTDRARRGLIRREGGRAVVYKDGTRRSYGDWATATVKAITATVFNIGFIRGAMRHHNAENFIIHDGPDCGLRSHNDPQHADGMVVSAEEAQNYPIAHPHCVRSFSISHGGKEPTKTKGEQVKKFVGAALKAELKASLTGTAIESAKAFAQQNDLGILAKEYLQKVVAPNARAFIARMHKVSVSSNLYDIQTGKLIQQKMSLAELAQEVMAYEDPYYATHQSEIPAILRQVVNGDVSLIHDVSHMDHMAQFSEMFDRNFRFSLNIADDFFSKVENESFKDALFNTFTDLTTKRFSSDEYLRLSFPGITSDIARASEPGVRLTYRNAKLIKTSLTKTVSDLRAAGTLNPNGFLRMGFKVDQLTKALTPQLRLLPSGPLRLSMTLNRAGRPYYDIRTHEHIGEAGRITSMTTRVTLATPRYLFRRADAWLGVDSNSLVSKAIQHMGFDIGATMRTDLRRLGLQNLSDVRKLTKWDLANLWHAMPEDVSPLTGEPARNLFQMVNVIAHIRVHGGQFFDMISSLRLNFHTYSQEARMMWELSDLQARLYGLVLPRSPFKQTIIDRNGKLWRAKPKSVPSLRTR